MGKASVLGVVIAASVILGLAIWQRFPPVAAKGEIVPDADADGPTQIIGNDELMKLLFDTNYVLLRKNLEEEPRDRAWRQVYIGAYTLAEVTNLLYSREDEEYMLTDEWRDLVKIGRKAAIDVGEAVKLQDYDLTLKNYLVLIETCNACHEKFELEKPTLVEAFLQPVD